MELRPAESKSLIRRKTVKVNTGQAAAPKPGAATRTAFFLRSFSLFKRFYPDIFFSYF